MTSGAERGSGEPLFSLVIATLGEDGALRQCLASLAMQADAPGFEVIVVDQNGDDRLEGAIAQFAGRHVRKPLAAEMGRRAEERYWRMFTAERMGEAYVRLYRELAPRAAES